MRSRPVLLVAALASLLVLGTFDAAAAKLANDHVFSDPQPLPATFKVQAPDSGQQQYAIFEVSGKGPKKFFKTLKVDVKVNSVVAEGVLRYTTGITKPKTTNGVTTVLVLLPINNVSEGGPLAVQPGSVCSDQNSQPIECPPGTLDVTISPPSSAKGVRLAGTLDAAARLIIDDVFFDEVVTLRPLRWFDYGFPTPAKKIAGFVKSDAKKNDVEKFNAPPPPAPV